MNRRVHHSYSRSAAIVRAAKRRRRVMARLTTIAIVFLLCISLTGGIVVLAGSSRQQEPTYKYYTSVIVESGDTLWDIALEYYQDNNYSDVRDYIKELKQLNNMTDDTLISGRKLVVSYYSTELK